jgi:hypothetical protein
MTTTGCRYRRKRTTPEQIRRVAALVQQADAADEARLEPSGSIIVGGTIVNQGKVVRASQLIRSVSQTSH